jgi:hypothetical protein
MIADTDIHHPPQLAPSLLSLTGSAPIDASSHLYWRSRRNSPLDVHQWPTPSGRKSYPGDSKRW